MIGYIGLNKAILCDIRSEYKKMLATLLLTNVPGILHIIFVLNVKYQFDIVNDFCKGVFSNKGILIGVGIALLALTNFFMWIAISIDPGIIPRNVNPFSAQQKSQQQ